MTHLAIIEATAPAESKKFTFRKNGKCHRGLEIDGWFVASCSCPGSKNGLLINKARRIAEGWEAANCGG